MRIIGATIRLYLAALLLAVMLLPARQARAGDPGKEPTAIVEVGAAAERATTGGDSSYGPSVAVEITPIEHWLEIEAGVAPMFARGQTDWDVDLLFKKPFVLSPTTEFMIGVGPSWSHTIAQGRTDDEFGAEVALDFMFWPWKGRTIGWYVEPSYGYGFTATHERTLSVSAGLLIPLP
jgi:hypothetical protein